MSHTALSCANFPVDGDGRVYHLGLKPGDLTNRIVTVGDASRAILIASYMDGGEAIDPTNYKEYLNFKSKDLTIITSKRHFTTVTGRYRNIPVSVIAIGMGTSMMDFFVREARAIVQGQMHIIRFGSCGSLGTGRAGDVLVASESVLCTRNPDFEFGDSSADCKRAYMISKPVQADIEITKNLVKALEAHVPEKVHVQVGLDVTTDSFYSTQGRIDSNFHDHNADLFETLAATFPHSESLQMETFQLLHLAKSCASVDNTIRTAAFAMVFAHRRKDTWISPEDLQILEPLCAKASLDAIIAAGIEKLHPEENSLWAK